MIERVYSYLEPLAEEVDSISRNGVATCLHVHPKTLRSHPEIAQFAETRRLAVHADEEIPTGAFYVTWDYLN